MHAAGESDSSIVPKKPANNDGPMASGVAKIPGGLGIVSVAHSKREWWIEHNAVPTSEFSPVHGACRASGNRPAVYGR
jgi:hypothetical protein